MFCFCSFDIELKALYIFNVYSYRQTVHTTAPLNPHENIQLWINELQRWQTGT